MNSRTLSRGSVFVAGAALAATAAIAGTGATTAAVAGSPANAQVDQIVVLANPHVSPDPLVDFKATHEQDQTDLPHSEGATGTASVVLSSADNQHSIQVPTMTGMMTNNQGHWTMVMIPGRTAAQQVLVDGKAYTLDTNYINQITEGNGGTEVYLHLTDHAGDELTLQSTLMGA